MNENDDDLEQLGRKLGRALRTDEVKSTPLSLRAQIRAATNKEAVLPSWRWAAAAAGVALLMAIIVWKMPHGSQTGAQQGVAVTMEEVALLERAALRPLLLLEAGSELETENRYIAVELYREACATATHPVVAWLAASEVRRLEEELF